MAVAAPYLAALLAATATLSYSMADAGDLKPVWTLDLSTVLDAKSVKHTRDLPVLALRFSPSGERLAIVADEYGPGAGSHRLIVIDVSHPDLSPQIFEIGEIFPGENGPGPDAFGWSPSGGLIFSGQEVVNVKQGKKCELPTAGSFITDGVAISQTLSPPDWNALASHLSFFSPECSPLGRWDVPEYWSLIDVSPDRGLLSVSRLLGFPNKRENLIVDPVSRNVVHRWAGAAEAGGEFADSGEAVCRGSDAEAAERAPVTCWDVDTGKKINVAPTVNGGDPIATALHASRIVASDYHRRRILFSSDWAEDLERRVIWDFRSGKELVSWRPKFQSWDAHLDEDPSRPPDHLREPLRFAISPDGEHLVEGGAGKIYLYKIEP